MKYFFTKRKHLVHTFEKNENSEYDNQYNYARIDKAPCCSAFGFIHR